ncbi:MFS transporter [Myxococcota bacterium]|nr:MFS transporter [Myxococcota bacterium]MBU1380067.1 MFS transporter [Myxococcota bacterium]MBU1495525.1 MFS transporter [Myxococcota bacterium]
MSDFEPNLELENVGVFKKAIREIVGPFKSLAHTSRALWGLYISYVFEGLVYFGVLTILGKYLSENVGLTDLHAGWVYSLFTGGITLAMLFLGGIVDKIGVRKSMLLALLLLLGGRIFLALSGIMPHGHGAFSMMFLLILVGLIITVLGYGMYQPAAYAGVKQFTDEKSATMGYAMIYGLMNLGAFFSGLLSPIIRENYGIVAVFITFAFFSFLAFVSFSRITTEMAAKAGTLTEIDKKGEKKDDENKEKDDQPELPVFKSPYMWALISGAVISGVILIYLQITAPAGYGDNFISTHVKKTGEAAKWIKTEITRVKKIKENKEKISDKEKTPDTKKLKEISDSLAKNITSVKAPANLAKGLKVDNKIYEIIKTLFLSDIEILSEFSKDFSKFTVEDKFEKELKDEIYSELRSLGIFYMSISYSMKSEFNGRALRRLQATQKKTKESRIPLSETWRKTILETNKLPLEKRINSLETVVTGIKDKFYGKIQKNQWFILIMTKEIELLKKLTAFSSSNFSAASREIIVSRLYYTGHFYIKTLAEDINSEKDPFSIASQVASNLKITSQISETLKSSSEAGIIKPASYSLKKFMIRYGILSFICLLFIILAIHFTLSKKPDHPFHNSKFVFFIFILIPVQTLFAHNWLTLPYYIDRAFAGTAISKKFELFSNINPLLIFLLTPFVGALTQRIHVYKMMLAGTLVMAIPTLLLVFPPSPVLLLTYILLMSIGEAMWQPRFLQWVAQIAPEGKTGIYMGIAQFPWFLTKVLTGLYSGYLLSKYCPLIGPQNTEMMWLIHTVIALVTPVGLILAASWMLKGGISSTALKK